MSAAGDARRAMDRGRKDPCVCLDQARIDREAALGNWPDQTLLDSLEETVRTRPDDIALIGVRSASGACVELTYAELNERAGLIAANLRRLGVAMGDIVSFQLPNWWQFVAIHLACLRIGAISNPLMPIFRSRELEFMVGFAESKVLIVPADFGKFDYCAMALELQVKLDTLQHVLVIGGEGEASFEDVLLGDHGVEPILEGTPINPNTVIELLYTSGTTGQPKGVMHTSNTLLTSVIQVSDRLQLGPDDIGLMPAPLAHQVGFCFGMTMAIYLGIPVVLMDAWIPARGAELIERHGVTFTCASTPFITDLNTLADVEKRNLERFTKFFTSGAPIQQSVIDDAIEILGVELIAGWGMSEVIQATATQALTADSGPLTDGTTFPGCEVRIVDADDVELPRGTEGRLQFRGSTQFVGYFARPELNDIDEEGWFETGDLARMDEEGNIRIVGRSKDIIIRGGENIPVFEIESLIFDMPEVESVAVVAMPDERLGERACAFVALQPGASLTFEDMIAYLETRDLARQYLPERLELIEEMPRTPSGKIQKFVLRNIASGFSDNG